MCCHILGHKLHIGWLEKNKRQHWDLLPWKLVFLPLTFALTCLWLLSQHPIWFPLDQTGIKKIPVGGFILMVRLVNLNSLFHQSLTNSAFTQSLNTVVKQLNKNSKNLTADRLCIDFFVSGWIISKNLSLVILTNTQLIYVIDCYHITCNFILKL